MDLLAIKRSLMPMSGPQDMGGGGGGGAPAQSQTQTQDLPEWAKPYAKDVLSKGSALTDVSQNPYQAYKGERIAGFNELQKSAMGNVASPEAWGKNVQGFMSPYMQNVVDVQQRNAREQAGAQMGGLNARAAQMGAFGGSGIALQRAAQGRDLQRQLGDIQATGSQNAFQAAQQSAAQNLQNQVQLGGMQQQQEQKGYDTAYQDFLTQKNYPYQQLSYMSNLIRGTPMGMNTTSQVYQNPSTLSQVAGLGTAGIAGLGMYNAMNASDIRAKENIELVGKLPNGLNLYEFEYKPELKEAFGHGRFKGVMAQEVEQFMPEAVGDMGNGYKGVNYALIGAEMEAV